MRADGAHPRPESRASRRPAAASWRRTDGPPRRRLPLRGHRGRHLASGAAASPALPRARRPGSRYPGAPAVPPCSDTNTYGQTEQAQAGGHAAGYRRRVGYDPLKIGRLDARRSLERACRGPNTTDDDITAEVWRVSATRSAAAGQIMLDDRPSACLRQGGAATGPLGLGDRDPDEAGRCAATSDRNSFVLGTR